MCWSLNPNTSECDAYMKTVLTETIRFNEVVRVGPNPIWLVPLQEKKFAHTHRGRQCEGGDSHLSTRRRKKTSEKCHCQHLDVWFLASRPWGKNSNTQSLVPCYCNPSKLIRTGLLLGVNTLLLGLITFVNYSALAPSLAWLQVFSISLSMRGGKDREEGLGRWDDGGPWALKTATL